MKYLNKYVRPHLVTACENNSEAWKDLGRELIPGDSSSVDAALSRISVNNHDDVTGRCSTMLAVWLEREPNASWGQLVNALRVTNLGQLATEIERKLRASTTDTTR